MTMRSLIRGTATALRTANGERLPVGALDDTEFLKRSGQGITSDEAGPGGSSAAEDITVAATPSNYTPAAANVEEHLKAIDAALATAGDGNTILNGTGAPDNGLGDDGDFYVDTAAWDIYGPKAAGAWPAGESLIGPQGETGAAGAAGATGATGAAGAAGAAGADGLDGDGNPTFLAGEFRYPATAPAPLDEDTGTYNTILRHLFDDTTEEAILCDFRLPANLDSAGTVTFAVVGYAVTAASSKNTKWKVSHRARAANEVWDVDYATKESGDKAISGTQDQLDVLTWTETVSNLGWAAGDFVTIKLSRLGNATNDLTGDYGVVAFQVVIPRA